MNKPNPAAAKRLGLIPPYLFQELDELKARARGDLIDLGEGSPDQPTPVSIQRAFERALKKAENHRYPTYAGKLSARQAVAGWYRRRFGVKLDPDGEVCMLIGSKEGVGHLIWGTCGPGDAVGVPDPNYPIYPNQTRLAGARPVFVPLEAGNGFVPDLTFLAKVGPELKLLCLNFPNNPTAAVADIGLFREVVALARRHGFFVLNDCVYSELYFGRKRPPSILQVPGAKDCCIEFHSLSKTFNMAGWRIGMAVGNRELIKALLRIKQNTDSGPFGAIQDAGAYALRHSDALTAKTRSLYLKRRDAFCEELAIQGWGVDVPEATFYVWTRTPGRDDYGFVLDMLKNCRVVAAPGSGFGRFGRGFVRFALVENEQRLRRAARRIGKWIRMKGRRDKGAKG
jgi:LL-diaminopimelate aminotransferase